MTFVEKHWQHVNSKKKPGISSDNRLFIFSTNNEEEGGKAKGRYLFSSIFMRSVSARI